jgi:membrane protein DedA with SNARE-associated domain
VNSLATAFAAAGSLLLLVALGSAVPVLPTGAAVSAAAVVAAHREAFTVLIIVVAGAVGAYLGDLGTYWICRSGGVALANKLRLTRESGTRLEPVAQRLNESPVPVLLVSRLVPGGRVPVLLAAAVLGVGWRRFAVANAYACLLWSAVYAAIGLLGGSLFPEPWEGIVAAIVVILLLSQLASWLRRRREREASEAIS